MATIQRIIREKPALITFFILLSGLYAGTEINIKFLLIGLVSSLLIYLFIRKDPLLLILLALSASIYQGSRRPIKWERLFFSGFYIDNRVIDPVFGELRVNLPLPQGCFVTGSGEYIEWKSIRRLVDWKIKRRYPTPLNKLFRIRDLLDKKIERSIPGDVGKMCSAILLGRRGKLPSYLYKRFQTCGAAHLLAVSGLHTGIVFTVIFVFLSVIRLKRKVRLILSCLIVSLYALITGLRLPVLRASIMLWFFIIGEIGEKNIDSFNTLSGAGIFIVLLMPGSVYSISFQLSFLAVFSMLIMFKALENQLRMIPNNWFKNWFVTPLLVTLSAQLGTLPLVAYYFGYIPLFGLVANIILVPLVGTLISGIFMLWLFPFLEVIIGNFVWGVGFLMNKLMIFLENIPYSVVKIREGDGRIFIAYTILLIFIIYCGYRKK